MVKHDCLCLLSQYMKMMINSQDNTSKYSHLPLDYHSSCPFIFFCSVNLALGQSSYLCQKLFIIRFFTTTPSCHWLLNKSYVAGASQNVILKQKIFYFWPVSLPHPLSFPRYRYCLSTFVLLTPCVLFQQPTLVVSKPLLIL